MTRYIVFLALLLSVLAIQRRGLKSAFLDVWLPFFLLVPLLDKRLRQMILLLLQ